MGDGSRISLWYDSWLPTGPLIETLGSRAMERSGVSPVCSVRDFYSGTAWMDYISGGSLRLSRVRRCIFDFIRDLVSSSHLLTPSTQDRVIWLPSPGGMFSIALAWRKLRCTHPRVPWADLVWFQGAVPRFAVIEWMVFMERLPTRHHLFSIGVADSSTCCLCQCRRETMDHLFFPCSFSSEVWRLTLARHVPPNFPVAWSGIQALLYSPGRHPLRRDRRFTRLLSECLYYIWMERNKWRIGESPILFFLAVTKPLSSSSSFTIPHLTNFSTSSHKNAIRIINPRTNPIDQSIDWIDRIMGFDFESLTEATSGAVGALVSTTILYPLDTCKTKYQAEARSPDQQKYRNLTDVLWEAIRDRQVLSLYQGLGTKNLQSFISQFIYFYGYSFFKRLYLKKSGLKSIDTKANLIIAAAAGACTCIITQPLDTASSRMQTSEFGKSKGLWKTLSERTWSDAFDGLGISLLLTSNPSIQYTVFDQLKQKLLLRKGSNGTGPGSSPEALSAFAAFVLGALSKSIATCLTYPLIRCKVVIQAADSDEDGNQGNSRKSHKTISSVSSSIWRSEGIPGFFKGLQAQILKTVLSSALLLMIKEKISKTTWVLMLAIRSYLFTARARLKGV
ncbi:hypothetical protein Droror1_Dr00007787 [Drosera rotundifolia]